MVKVKDIEIGLNKPFVLIAGPCVIESEATTMFIAENLKLTTEYVGVPLIFKASFDKANRTSIDSFRGPANIHAAMRILEKVRTELDLPIISDVHDVEQIKQIMNEFPDTLDVLQIPAFLCRQTDLLLAAADTGKPLNIKKGQFLAPEDMKHVVAKATSNGNKNVMVCERGACFGYNNLVSDMTSLVTMRETGCPVIFDATHSVQKPGGGDGKSTGNSELAPYLARAAAAVGVAGIFMETHPAPEHALSDGPNSIPLYKMRKILEQLKSIDELTKSFT